PSTLMWLGLSLPITDPEMVCAPSPIESRNAVTLGVLCCLDWPDECSVLSQPNEDDADESKGFQEYVRNSGSFQCIAPHLTSSTFHGGRISPHGGSWTAG